MIPEVPARKEIRKFQFSLSLLLGAILYAAALATVSVNLVGRAWNPWQIGAAYFVTIACVVGFAVLSKARGKVAAYVLLSPLVFVASVVAAAMFHLRQIPQQVSTGAVAIPATTASVLVSPQAAHYSAPPESSPGTGAPIH